MRNLLTKATVGAIVAGAALTVAACGGTTTTTNTTTNTTTTELGNDVMMDANAMDMGMDTNMGMNAMPPARWQHHDDDDQHDVDDHEQDVIFRIRRSKRKGRRATGGPFLMRAPGLRAARGGR